jgi:WD40 repeat protein
MKVRNLYAAFLFGLFFLSSVQASCETEGALALITEPTEANIYVDGQLKVNMTPVVIKLSPGKHHIEIVATGKLTKTLDIFLAEGTLLSPKKIVLVDLPISQKIPSSSKPENGETKPEVKHPPQVSGKQIIAEKVEADSKLQESPPQTHKETVTTEERVSQPKSQPKPSNHAGTAYLNKAGYDMIEGMLPLRIEWQKEWQEQAKEFGLFDLGQITVKQEEFHALWEEGQQKPVYVEENIENQIKVRKVVLKGIKRNWMINSAKSDFTATPLTTKLYKTLRGHNGDVNSVSFSNDGRFLASGSNDNTIKLWKINAGKKLKVEEWKTLLGHEDDVKMVAFISDANILVSTDSDDTILRWEITSGKKSLVRPQNEVISSVAFSPNGHIITGSYDYTITLWEIMTAKVLRIIKKANQTVAMTFSADGNILASGNKSSTITLWKVNTGEKLQVLKGQESTINTMTFSPDGRIFASGGMWDEILLWNTNTGKLLNILQPWSFFGSNVYSIAFSPDGRILASGSGDETITLWEVNTGMKLHSLEGEGDDVRVVDFSPVGHILASGHDDDTIKLWIP